MAEKYEFSANQELAMRRKRRADPSLLAQVDRSYEPVAAQEARDMAAKRVRNTRAMPDAYPISGKGDREDRE